MCNKFSFKYRRRSRKMSKQKYLYQQRFSSSSESEPLLSAPGPSGEQPARYGDEASEDDEIVCAASDNTQRRLY